ncbi:uncharacterized protein LAESUDRAFT_691432 [Laetiporus sulphureus 93-53]|uniref:Cep57 centrosome microtubule-binding domain-containing protein n=1 Tax=Laetiporus sulphureus 93-53 TaxID=1314785 RepID=A0A165HUS9_9APHY|nr:uncharacterized protein LAESUDRAFT_691432 [Laetiporus sulphureus 93-53]KZT12216.1 hypothetical protein LAESUDRAFT_691432 [Laetiporus sulphureus 93-53]
MSRGSANLEFSIRGDELERNRILLERNLQHTDLSLHLSSAPEDDFSDVEYPRNHPAPSPFTVFASFEQRSGDHLEAGEHSQLGGWSYQSFDPGDTVNPYGGETMSTAAHHASALTLSAGLAGRGSRRDVSLSGAEYDPDRPLQGIMAGFEAHFSALGMDPVKDKQLGPDAIAFDPLVVDDPAGLDKVFLSSHPPIRHEAVRSPISSFTSSTSESDSGSARHHSPASRPKLSDALNAITFSPKRPRSAPTNGSSRPSVNNQRANLQSKRSRSPPQTTYPSLFNNERSAPRPNKPTTGLRSPVGLYQTSLSYAQPDPEVTVQPPTPPPPSSSHFVDMARKLVQEIQTEKRQQAEACAKRSAARAPVVPTTRRDARVATQAKERGPFKNLVNQAPSRSVHASNVKTTNVSKGRIYLPDVTGLTSAVESPAKAGMDYYDYNAMDDGQHAARFIATLNAVQSKLAFLESENSISRRRMNELELELETCKKEVARERTRLLEQEVQASRDAAAAAAKRERHKLGVPCRQTTVNGLGHNVDPEIRCEEPFTTETRYKQAVEEKKALEALIGTLRNHLSRLTSELSDHQQLLNELRMLRDVDARALAEKGKDMDNLRTEVERLAGEVEVLRGVVEEGLKERRNERDPQEATILEPSEELTMETQNDEPSVQQQRHDQEDSAIFGVDDGQDDGDDGSMFRGHRAPTPTIPVPDHTTRAEIAPVGSSRPLNDPTTRPLIDTDDAERVYADVHGRRADRSASLASSRSSSSSHSRISSRSVSPALSARISHSSATSHQSMEDERKSSVAFNPRRTSGDRPANTPPRNAGQLPSRPMAPTPGIALKKMHTRAGRDEALRRAPERHADPPVDAPFPQIRGAHLERLFFSAPEHNAQTCTVCHRRRRNRAPGKKAEDHADFWMEEDYRKLGKKAQDDGDDEGFAEGSDDGIGSGGHQRDEIPPQTVLTRVVRELEDDFTHYKSIYVELAEQYKEMDAVSNVAKRNVVAGHLREVIDILEQKGDQIASLYGLLTFKDKPVEQPAATEQDARPVPDNISSWGRARGRKTCPSAS